MNTTGAIAPAGNCRWGRTGGAEEWETRAIGRDHLAPPMDRSEAAAAGWPTDPARRPLAAEESRRRED